jgi:hypothetical protein
MAGMPTVPVFDLKIHPRDRELIAATHGRNFFIVDIAPLEQMAGKQIADVTLFEPKRAWQFGEAPRMAASGNGDGQYTYSSPPAQYGAEIVYRIAPSATAGPTLAGSPASPAAAPAPSAPTNAAATATTPAGGATPPRIPPPAPLKVVIQDASGDTIATLNGSSSPGLQRVLWGFNGTRRLATVPPLGPADLRDSIVRARKTTTILDSLEKAGWDSTLIRQGRQLLLGPGGPNAPQMNINCGGGPGASPDRPAEGAVVRSGSAAGGCTMTVGGVNVDFDKYQEAQRLINRAINGPNPNAGGNVFFFGGPGNRGTQGFQASTGDYLVSISIGGKTYKQVLHVDRVTPGELKY